MFSVRKVTLKSDPEKHQETSEAVLGLDEGWIRQDWEGSWLYFCIRPAKPKMHRSKGPEADINVCREIVLKPTSCTILVYRSTG